MNSALARLYVLRSIAATAMAVAALPAVCQNPGPDNAAAPANSPVQPAPGDTPAFTVAAGTRIPLGLINSVSSKNSSAGDRVYLETVFPIVIDSHVIIPAGSYVTGTVTEVKRPGRVKGRGEIYVRFDTIMLPNGVSRDFRSRLGSIDARGDERLDKKEGEVKADSNKGGDVRTVAEAGASGAGLGSIVGLATGHPGMGAGIGGAAGAAAGLAGVLLTRGPDAVLAKGSTVEMILDRPLVFSASEVSFTTTGSPGRYSEGAGPSPKSAASPARRFPF